GKGAQFRSHAVSIADGCDTVARAVTERLLGTQMHRTGAITRPEAFRACRWAFGRTGDRAGGPQSAGSSRTMAAAALYAASAGPSSSGRRMFAMIRSTH